MGTTVYDLPNTDRFKLGILTQSAQNLAPIMYAVGAAKTRLDAAYGDAGFIAGLAAHTTAGAALSPAVTWPAAPSSGSAFGTFAAVVAALTDTELKANLQATNSDSEAVYSESSEIPMGAIGSLVDWLDGIAAPVLNDPVDADDNTYDDTVLLFAQYQLVLDAYATLFTQRGFTDPTL